MHRPGATQSTLNSHQQYFLESTGIFFSFIHKIIAQTVRKELNYLQYFFNTQ